MHAGDELTNRMRGLADEVDPRGVDRVKDSLGSLQPTPSRPLAIRRAGFVTLAAGALVAAVVVGALNVAGVLGEDGTSDESATGLRDDFQGADIRPGEPCPDARAVGLEALAEMAKTPVWMPDSPVANAETLTGSWDCAGIPALTFGEISLRFEPAGNLGNPEKLFQDLAADGNGGRVGNILGQPAFVKPPQGADGRGMVLVVLDGTLVRVIGDGKTPLEELINVADSLQGGNAAPEK